MVNEYADLLFTAGRYLPDPADPEGQVARVETYLAGLSRELEEKAMRVRAILNELDCRLEAVEVAATADATAEAGGDAT